jgi:hypothetical protein
MNVNRTLHDLVPAAELIEQFQIGQFEDLRCSDEAGTAEELVNRALLTAIIPTNVGAKQERPGR